MPMKVFGEPGSARASLGIRERRNGNASTAPAPWRKNRLERRSSFIECSSLDHPAAEGLLHDALHEHRLEGAPGRHEPVAQAHEIAPVGFGVRPPPRDELEVALDEAR